MATTAVNPNISSQSTDNQFKLSDHENETRVTLNLDAGGPVVVGVPAKGPVLQYEGPEGTHSFSGDQIVTENTALGAMYTVTLNIVPDLRALSFTLLLPPVINKTNSPQPFKTLAVKWERHLTLVGPPPTGAELSYSAIKMHGTAEQVPIPLVATPAPQPGGAVKAA
jgi:hypothetical protein